MSMTGLAKSSATTLNTSVKHAVTLSALNKPGAGWKYDDPNLTYNQAKDIGGRDVLYDGIGYATVLTPLTKHTA